MLCLDAADGGLSGNPAHGGWRLGGALPYAPPGAAEHPLGGRSTRRRSGPPANRPSVLHTQAESWGAATSVQAGLSPSSHLTLLRRCSPELCVCSHRAASVNQSRLSRHSLLPFIPPEPGCFQVGGRGGRVTHSRCEGRAVGRPRGVKLGPVHVWLPAWDPTYATAWGARDQVGLAAGGHTVGREGHWPGPTPGTGSSELLGPLYKSGRDTWLPSGAHPTRSTHLPPIPKVAWTVRGCPRAETTESRPAGLGDPAHWGGTPAPTAAGPGKPSLQPQLPTSVSPLQQGVSGFKALGACGSNQT